MQLRGFEWTVVALQSVMKIAVKGSFGHSDYWGEKERRILPDARVKIRRSARGIALCSTVRFQRESFLLERQ